MEKEKTARSKARRDGLMACDTCAHDGFLCKLTTREKMITRSTCREHRWTWWEPKAIAEDEVNKTP